MKPTRRLPLYLAALAIVTAAPSAALADAPVAELGKVKIEAGGFVAAQITFDTNNAVGQNHLISVEGRGEAGRVGFAFDATRLGLTARLASSGWSLQARAEADMQSAIHFRIRHAYASASHGGTTLLLGQTDTLVGNRVGPNVFNNDWFWAQGNAYDRLLQFRLSHQAGPVLLAIAALPNLHGAPDAAPHAQARVEVRRGAWMIGASGHFGVSSRVASPADPAAKVNRVISSLGALDAAATLGVFELSAQGWIGAGAAHGTGGHSIGNPLFVLDPSGAPVSVPSAGGFVDVLIKAHRRFSAGVAAGVSVVTSTSPGRVAVPVASNATAAAYASFAVLPSWAFAWEAQGARTVRAIEAADPGVRVAMYDGRLLFGQKLSF